MLSVSLEAQIINTPERIIPDEINIEICATYFNTIKVPAINLYLLTPRYVSKWTSANFFTDICFLNNKILIEVLGYDQTDNSEFFDNSDLIDFGFLENTIKTLKILPNYFKNDSLKIEIKLNKEINDFILKKNELKYDLIPLKIKNVKVDTTAASIVLYPPNVYNLYIAGNTDPKKNYLEELKNFTKKKGMRIASSIYDQVPLGTDYSINIILEEKEYYELKERVVGHLSKDPKITVQVKEIMQFCKK